jgi:hypothetical protein
MSFGAFNVWRKVEKVTKYLLNSSQRNKARLKIPVDQEKSICRRRGRGRPVSDETDEARH